MQKKNYLNQKLFYKKKFRGIKSTPICINKFKFDKNLLFFRKTIKYKSYGRKDIHKIKDSKVFSHRLNIKITQNNIFCSFVRNTDNIMFDSCSSGKYKIKTSKKKIKHTFDLVLNSFFSSINKKQVYKGVMACITSPIKIRKKIVHLVSLNFKKIPLLIKVLKKKSFNGCRPPKKIRKKRRGLILLK
jgi:ribosomal protein S11